MLVVESVAALRDAIQAQKKQGAKIGFVPTMGNLHQGHLNLVMLAKQKADFTVASIFVNPMQFGQGEDYERYPRTHQQDKDKLLEAGCDLLFLPAVETIYPRALVLQTRVEVPGLSDILCGKYRSGHFAGVATVVNKLFNLVTPDMAIFGEKDFQQLMVIRHMVEDLCMPVEIVGAPIVREDDGLAMSSRNGYLSEPERKMAPAIYAILKQVANGINNTDTTFRQLEQDAMAQLETKGFACDYLEIRKADDLQQAENHDADVVILVAAHLGNTRLIDNLVVKK